MEIVKHFEVIENIFSTIFIEFDDVDAGRHLILTSRFARQSNWVTIISTAQKMKFPTKDFFSKCDQICSFLWI